MTEQQDNKRKVRVIHPFLLGPFFVLRLYGDNIDHFPFQVTLAPIVILTALSLVMWGLLCLILRNRIKAGIIVFVFYGLFLSYSYVLELVFLTLGESIARHGVVLPALTAIGVVIALAVMISKRPLLIPTTLLNLLTIGLVIVVVGRIGLYSFRNLGVSGYKNTAPADAAPGSAGPKKDQVLPDIYYLIMDGYARADILKDKYDYDNTAFLKFLTDKGFFVAPWAGANYCQTGLSLASSLNMRYLDDLRKHLGGKSANRVPLKAMIYQNEVTAKLRAYGYRIICFPSGYNLTSKIEKATCLYWQFPGQFDDGLLETTPFPVLEYHLSGGSSGAYARHRRRILYTLDHLADPPKSSAPVFAFVHLVCPHPPFVFRSDGRHIQPRYGYLINDGNHWRGQSEVNSVEMYRALYAEQVAFLNTRLKKVINALLSLSRRPAIILLQADHGPGSSLHWGSIDKSDVVERLTILSAYYFPNKRYDSLHESISPVNTFRVVFNRYFQSKYPLLEDKSFFSLWLKPYKFTDVTLKVQLAAGKSPLK